jgi:hypothetical protein
MGLLWSEGGALVFTFVLAGIAAALLLFIRLTQPEEWRRLTEQYRAARRGGLSRRSSLRSRSWTSSELGDDEVFPRPYVPAPDIPPALRTVSNIARWVIVVVSIGAAIGMALLIFGVLYLMTHLPGWS